MIRDHRPKRLIIDEHQFVVRTIYRNFCERKGDQTRALTSRGNFVVTGVTLLLFVITSIGLGAEITISDKGEGCDYLSGAPIKLPASILETNLFGPGARVIQNRKHTAQAAVFNASGALGRSEPATTGVFPAYLVGHHYLSLLQEVRQYTNYCCTVTVKGPVTFYLLVDNRVNDFGELSSLDDPTFGPPDTEWIPQDGWQRVNTGISPKVGGTNRADYVRIFEGGIGTGAVDQFYAIYSKTLTNGGAINLRTQFAGNIFCLVIATNMSSTTVKTPAQTPVGRPAGG